MYRAITRLIDFDVRLCVLETLFLNRAAVMVGIRMSWGLSAFGARRTADTRVLIGAPSSLSALAGAAPEEASAAAFCFAGFWILRSGWMLFGGLNAVKTDLASSGPTEA